MCSRVAIVSMLAIAQFALLPGRILVAQSAEAVRIEINDGTHETTVKGGLRGRQQMEYVIAAQKDQQLRLRLASSAKQTLRLQLWNPDGTEVPLGASGTAIIPATGDYEIWVLRTGSRAGISAYQLTVALH